MHACALIMSDIFSTTTPRGDETAGMVGFFLGNFKKEKKK
jgi:hypothetical protein